MYSLALPRAMRGFGLIELVIAIAVAAVLAAIALPGFSGILRNNRISAKANELVGALNLARSEALTRGRPVSVCASADGATCSASTAWNAGWIVFADGGTPGNVDGSDSVLRAWPAIDAQDGLTTTANFVRFTAAGTAETSALFTVKPQSCSGIQRRDIDLATSGRVSLRRLGC